MAEAAAAPRTLAASATWQQTIAFIDAWPGVPSWAQIEREVDGLAGEAMPFIAQTAPGDRCSKWLNHYCYVVWRSTLATRYPAVHTLMQQTQGGRYIIDSGPPMLFRIRWVPDRYAWAWMLHVEWLNLTWHNQTASYGLTLLSESDTQMVIQEACTSTHMTGASTEMPGGFLHTLHAHVQQIERTRLAQSGLIDRLALRDADAAQYLARFVAPLAITPQHPLRIREHASQVRAMRASLAAMDRPDAVLGRVCSRDVV